MKSKLFIKELFGSKVKLSRFILISILIYTLICIQLVFISKSLDNDIYGDVEFNGKSSVTSVTFLKYGEITNGFNQYIDTECIDTTISYNLVERNIIQLIKPNSLENVTYTLMAFENEFFDNIIRQDDLTGEKPEIGKKEMIVGCYAAEAFDLNIGDKFHSKDVEIGSLGTVGITADLSGELSEIEYEIVGVLNLTSGALDYSLILPMETQENIMPNKVWTYFINDSSRKNYIDNLVNGDSSFIGDYEIGSINELYHSKTKGFLGKLFDISYIFLLMLVFVYLQISYIIKGINRKLGIMKAFGISDRYIYSTYLGGMAIIQFVSMLISAIILNIIVLFANRFVSESYGYSINMYVIKMDTYLILFSMCAVFIMAIWAIISYKIIKVSPKTAMKY